MEDQALNDLNKAKDNSRVLMVVIVVLLTAILVSAYFVYQLLTGGAVNDVSEEDTEPTPTPTILLEDTTIPSPTTTSEGETGTGAEVVPVPDNWKAVESESLDFTAYRPNNWYFRIFSGSTLGLDSAAIPEVSDYAGSIVINVDSNFSQTLSEQKSNLENEVETTKLYDNGEWTILEGTTPANVINDEQKTKVALTEVNGKVFVVTLSKSVDTFNSYLDEFTTVVGTLVIK